MVGRVVFVVFQIHVNFLTICLVVKIVCTPQKLKFSFCRLFPFLEFFIIMYNVMVTSLNHDPVIDHWSNGSLIYNNSTMPIAVYIEKQVDVYFFLDTS